MTRKTWPAICTSGGTSVRKPVVGRRKRRSYPTQHPIEVECQLARAGPPEGRFLVPPYELMNHPGYGESPLTVAVTAL